jgi:hypothetical protein
VRLEAASAAPARILAGCKRTRILTATIFVGPTRSRRAMRNTSLPSDVSMNSPDSVTASGSFTCAVRWLLDQRATAALWGARHPGQLQPIAEVFGWSLDAAAKTEVDRILRESIIDPAGPDFMAPPLRYNAGVLEVAH